MGFLINTTSSMLQIFKEAEKKMCRNKKTNYVRTVLTIGSQHYFFVIIVSSSIIFFLYLTFVRP